MWAPEDPFKAQVPAVVYMPLGFRAVLFGLVVANMAAALLVDTLANWLCALMAGWEGWKATWISWTGRKAPSQGPSRRQPGLLQMEPIPSSSSV
jgi:hypothetical protein